VTVRRITLLGEPILRQKSKKVHRVDASIQDLIEDMIETMHAAPGVGLSAPQVAVPLRIIVTYADEKVRAVINPEIVDQSEDMAEDVEGCLSIPRWYGPVLRHEKITVRGLGKNGKPVKIKTAGLEARVFQHEIDHLNGVLFLDHVEDRSKLYKTTSKEEEEEMEQENVYA